MVRDVLTSLSSARIPHAEDVAQVEALLRDRVETLLTPMVMRRARRIRITLLSLPVVMPVVACLTAVAAGMSGADVATIGAATTTLGLAALLGWAFFEGDEMLRECAESWAAASRQITPQTLLAPFGGIEALPVRYLNRAGQLITSGRERGRGTPSIQFELVWLYSQLDANERRVVAAQGGSDLSIQDVLAAWRACGVAPLDGPVDT